VGIVPPEENKPTKMLVTIIYVWCHDHESQPQERLGTAGMEGNTETLR